MNKRKKVFQLLNTTNWLGADVTDIFYTLSLLSSEKSIQKPIRAIPHVFGLYRSSHPGVFCKKVYSEN